MPAVVSASAAGRFGIQPQPAGDSADPAIGKRRHQLSQRVVREHLPCIGEDDDVEPGVSDAGVQRERLAASRDRDDVDEPAVAREDLERVVARSVGDDDDLTLR